MDIFGFVADYGPWSWMVLGLLLLGLELLVPGGYLVWMGVAGILTGLLTLFQPLSWPVQWLIFGVLSIGSIFIWTRWSKNRKGGSDKPLLNERTEQFVGQTGVLAEPIAGGFGRMRLGDTIWRVAGSDLPAGTRVTITGAEGNILRVEEA